MHPGPGAIQGIKSLGGQQVSSLACGILGRFSLKVVGLPPKNNILMFVSNRIAHRPKCISEI